MSRYLFKIFKKSYVLKYIKNRNLINKLPIDHCIRLLHHQGVYEFIFLNYKYPGKVTKIAADEIGSYTTVKNEVLCKIYKLLAQIFTFAIQTNIGGCVVTQTIILASKTFTMHENEGSGTSLKCLVFRWILYLPNVKTTSTRTTNINITNGEMS